MKKTPCQIILLLLTIPFTATEASNLNVNVKVTLAAPPCIVNDNKSIEINFYDVMTTRIGNGNYRTPINYTLDCKGASSNLMKLKIQGDGPLFDRTVLKTGTPGLGIELQEGSNKLAINTWLNFTYPNIPTLWAVPVKQKDLVLSGGEFSASAIMTIDYQ
ncbi:UNVERIFIED_ORG: type 1 fimbria pilin [Providencia alcalifaciens]